MNEVKDILTQLEQASHQGTIKRYRKINEVEPYYGVPKGAINQIAKQFKKQSELFMPLWRTGVLEAQYVAIQLGKPNDLSKDEVTECLSPSVSVNVLDKFIDHILCKRQDAEMWKAQLKENVYPIMQRLGWGLEVRSIIGRQLNHQEIEVILKVIEVELVNAVEVVKWMMNRCLVEIAVYYPEWRQYCIELGERLGVYRDMKVAKGCTSAYAPEWIAAVLRNKQ